MSEINITKDTKLVELMVAQAQNKSVDSDLAGQADKLIRD